MWHAHQLTMQRSRARQVSQANAALVKKVKALHRADKAILNLDQSVQCAYLRPSCSQLKLKRRNLTSTLKAS